jgi:hypothetical protein
MKNLFSIICLLVLSYNTHAQASQGTIMMEVTSVSSDDPQAQMMLESMKGATTEICYQGDKNALTMSMMGGMININAVSDKTANKFDMLMDMMGQKMWVNDKLDATSSPEQKETNARLKIEYNKEDKKSLVGYDCYAFKISDPENPEMLITGFVAPSLKVSFTPIQGLSELVLDGFPLEYTASAMGGKLVNTAKSYDKNVVDSKFALDTKGFTKMTMEEFKSKMGGMGGF